MTDPTIRPVNAADLPSLLEMVQALAAYHGDTALVDMDDLARDCLGSVPWLRVLVAAHGNDLIGYAALCPLVQLQFGVRGMDLHHLFVRQDVRGSGIGNALIAESIATAKALGCRYMTVGTKPDNVKAAQVYLAAGFEDLPPPGPRFRIKLGG